MREIKFKAKRIDNGEWVYGFYFETAIADENLNTITGYFIHTNEGGIPTDFLIDPSTLGQYTGHENAYEGDIIRDEYGQFWEIFWDDIGHALRARCPTETVPLYWFDKTEFSDVVGNIHDSYRSDGMDEDMDILNFMEEFAVTKQEGSDELE